MWDKCTITPVTSTELTKPAIQLMRAIIFVHRPKNKVVLVG